MKLLFNYLPSSLFKTGCSSCAQEIPVYLIILVHGYYHKLGRGLV